VAPLESHKRHLSALQRDQQRVALDAALDLHAQVCGDTTPDFPPTESAYTTLNA
jgi:hypothetical protein